MGEAKEWVQNGIRRCRESGPQKRSWKKNKTPKVRRMKEIIKIRAEINEKEKRKQ